jgi:hypothetical protein
MGGNINIDTRVTSFLTGTGGIGTYGLNIFQNVASTNITAGILVYVQITAGSNLEDTLNILNNSNFLSNPTFTGTEHIDLTTLTATSLLEDITALINQSGGPQNITAAQLAPIINNQYNNVQNSGLQSILGNLALNLIGNAVQLMFGGGGNIINNLLGSVFRSYLNPGIVSRAALASTKNIALAKVAYQLAQMFGNNSQAALTSNATAGLAAQVAQMPVGSSLTTALPGGGTVTVQNLGPVAPPK